MTSKKWILDNHYGWYSIIKRLTNDDVSPIIEGVTIPEILTKGVRYHKSTVQKHLRQLIDRNLVRKEKIRNEFCYYITKDGIKMMKEKV